MRFIPKEWLNFTNSGYPDQMLHSTVSDLGLHCLPVTLLRVSRLQWAEHGIELASMAQLDAPSDW